jgi:CheY-like chemotaxis protein
VIHDAVELSRPLIEGGRHTLALELPGQELIVRGDSVRLTQVFSNLLNNAAKYTPSGGLVKVLARLDGSDAMVEVIDNGAGLAPEMVKSVFEMFVQVSGTSKAAQGGLGIGLTLVKSLVELHGGSVTASSDGLGRGARFAVRLPLERNVVAKGPCEPSSRVKGAVTAIEGTVLVVDDNRDAADSLGELLGSMGVRALIAYSGEEALQVAANNELTTAVLDIGMPGMDGCDLARHLRAAQGGTPLTLIALTGWGQQADKERIAAAGFDHHLLKPLNLTELVPLL